MIASNETNPICSVATLRLRRAAGFKVVLIVIATMLLGSCAGGGTDGGGVYGRSTVGASRVQVCRTGDESINSSSACLDGDAACYQIADGSWCTGERGDSCPAGSAALAAGQACPVGARCFAASTNLTCAIGT